MVIMGFAFRFVQCVEIYEECRLILFIYTSLRFKSLSSKIFVYFVYWNENCTNMQYFVIFRCAAFGFIFGGF